MDANKKGFVSSYSTDFLLLLLVCTLLRLCMTTMMMMLGMKKSKAKEGRKNCTQDSSTLSFSLSRRSLFPDNRNTNRKNRQTSIFVL